MGRSLNFKAQKKNHLSPHAALQHPQQCGA